MHPETTYPCSQDIAFDPFYRRSRTCEMYCFVRSVVMILLHTRIKDTECTGETQKISSSEKVKNNAGCKKKDVNAVLRLPLSFLIGFLKQ
ncbi:hypothetical protein NPIL_623591 [Nephila pilipes]|uniref:Uncharacterized protein n=1 Tax=Nephila pilipes TaxID=299642 RepID=A0A8X6TYP5_NEPPI|nr:hypothetical protein NPIL_623591 [Nephila pilipes]